MHIPETLPTILRPTLLVISDASHALFFSARDRELDPAGELAIDYPPKDNIQRASIHTPSGMHSAEQSENLGMEKIHRFCHELAAELHHRIQADGFEEIYLSGAQEHLNQILDALPTDVRARVTKTLPKQVTKEAPLDILQRFME